MSSFTKESMNSNVAIGSSSSGRCEIIFKKRKKRKKKKTRRKENIINEELIFKLQDIRDHTPASIPKRYRIS